MVDDEHDAVGAGDGELFPVETELPDGGMVEGDLGAGAFGDVVAGPQLTELGAGQ